MYFANYEKVQISLEQELARYPNVEVAVEEVRKKSRKKAYTCPFCGEYLVLRVGTKYGPYLLTRWQIHILCELYNYLASFDLFFWRIKHVL